MKFTTEQFKALLNACDDRVAKLTPVADKSRQAGREKDVLDELAHSFSCMLSMIKESEG